MLPVRKLSPRKGAKAQRKAGKLGVLAAWREIFLVFGAVGMLPVLSIVGWLDGRVVQTTRLHDVATTRTKKRKDQHPRWLVVLILPLKGRTDQVSPLRCGLR